VLFWSVARAALVALSLLRACGARTQYASVARLCAKLARAGLARASTEAAGLRRRVSRGCPERAAVRAITALYIQQRYGPAADQEIRSHASSTWSGISPVRNIALAVLFALHAGFACAQPSSYQTGRTWKNSSRKW